MKRDTLLLTILLVLSVSSAIAAVAGWQVWPLFMIASLVMLVIVCIEAYLNFRKTVLSPQASKPRLTGPGLSPQEIEAALARTKTLIDNAKRSGAI